MWCCYRAHLLYSFCAHSVWCFYRAHLLQHPVVILVGAKIYYTLPTKDPKLPLPLPPAQPGQAQPGPAWPGPAWPGQVQARTGHALASVDPPSPTQRLDTETQIHSTERERERERERHNAESETQTQKISDIERRSYRETSVVQGVARPFNQSCPDLCFMCRENIVPFRETLGSSS